MLPTDLPDAGLLQASSLYSVASAKGSRAGWPCMKLEVVCPTAGLLPTACHLGLALFGGHHICGMCISCKVKLAFHCCFYIYRLTVCTKEGSRLCLVSTAVELRPWTCFVYCQFSLFLC